MFWPRTLPRYWCAARRRSAAPPSRPHRRAPRYEPRSPAQPLLVGYACHAHASEPNRGPPNGPRERRDDLLRRVAAAATQRRRSPSRPRRRSAHPNLPGRQIQNQRSRLDQSTASLLTTRSRSDGPNSRVPLRAAFLLKRPRSFLYSTRSPNLFKNISFLVQNLARSPPDLSRNRTRHPGPLILHSSP